MMMVYDARRMIKQKRWGGGGGDKSEHIYIEDKSNMRPIGVSIKINHSDDI
jgi:hypothetical protein